MRNVNSMQKASGNQMSQKKMDTIICCVLGGEVWRNRQEEWWGLTLFLFRSLGLVSAIELFIYFRV